MSGKIAYNMMLKVKGIRIAGTEGEKRCIKTLEQFLKDIKVAHEKMTFPIDISEVGRGSVSAGKMKLEGTPYGLSVPFNVSGELVCIESPEDFKNINIDFSGKIVMIKDRPGHKMFAEIKKKNVKAMITCSRTDNRTSSLHLSSWMFRDKCIIPMIDIKYADAVKLIEMNGKHVKAVGTGKTRKTAATSVIAKIDGTKKTKETIFVMGHIDSVPFSPGASDNSGGLGIMAELLSYFRKNPVKRNLVFCFFSGEEWGLWGSRYFVSKNKDIMGNINFGINIDVAGDIVGNNYCIVTGNDDICAVAKSIARYNGINIKVAKDIYSSDNMAFSYEGVPTLNLYRAGGLPSAYVHTSDDGMNHVSPDGLSALIDFSVRLISFAGDGAMNPIERRVDDATKKKIEDYFINRGIALDEITKNLPYKKKKD
ncbi:MAG: M28 family metallopeptidase [bacterium]